MDEPMLWLVWFRLVVLAVAYALLLSFSIRVCIPSEKRGQRGWPTAVGLLLLWGAFVAVVTSLGVPGAKARLIAEIAARMGLALPGGLLGAWGLRSETYRTIEPERLPLVKLPMRVTGFGLTAFALFGGLIGPAAPFFPADLVNEESVLSAIGVPVSLLRAISGATISYGVVRALSAVLDEIDMWLESVERMQALVDERERIGRELHDGIIQSIYASGLILEGAVQNIVENPGQAQTQLSDAIKNLNRTIRDIRRYIFDLRGEMPQDDLETGLRKMLKDFRVNTLLETKFVVRGDDSRRFDAERRQHILQVAREALTNVARHAHARWVEVSVDHGPNALELIISDDGVGLSSLPSDDGHGLRNLRERTRLVNGLLNIDTAPNEGLRLTLTVPYQQRVSRHPPEVREPGA
jgi:signal transduction histidine kinase